MAHSVNYMTLNNVAEQLKLNGFECDIVEAGGGFPDEWRIKCEDLHLRANVVGYGAKKGRIDWQAYPPVYEGVHYMERPTINDFQTMPEPNPKTVATRIIREMIEPSREAIARYKAKHDRFNADLEALPISAMMLREAGATVHEAKDCRGGIKETTGALYYTKNKASVSGTVNADGSIRITSGYFTPKQALAIIRLLEEMGE